MTMKRSMLLRIYLLQAFVSTIVCLPKPQGTSGELDSTQQFALRILENDAVGYFGCYQDPSNIRLLSGKVTRDIGNVQDCAIYCKDYQYFGVEDKTQCFCGNDLNPANLPIGDGSCAKYLCEHEAGPTNCYWICGGSNMISVYITQIHLRYMETFVNESQRDATGYIGCYPDPTDDRLLQFMLFRGIANVQACAVHCSGFSRFGLEMGHQCFCDFSSGKIATATTIEDVNCSIYPCLEKGPTNSYWMCGGPNRIAVYDTRRHLRYMEQFTNQRLVWRHDHLGFLG